MKTIEITDEMYNSLMELSKEINSQNHRATAMPYFFQIQTKKEVYVSDGCGEEVWVCDGSVLESDEEIKEAVIEFKEWDEDEADEKFAELDEWEIDVILENNYRKVNRDYEDKYQNSFFTAKSCKEHIAANKHHYTEPVDYLSHAFRNPEMEMVLKFLCELTI